MSPRLDTQDGQTDWPPVVTWLRLTISRNNLPSEPRLSLKHKCSYQPAQKLSERLKSSSQTTYNSNRGEKTGSRTNILVAKKDILHIYIWEYVIISDVQHCVIIRKQLNAIFNIRCENTMTTQEICLNMWNFPPLRLPTQGMNAISRTSQKNILRASALAFASWGQLRSYLKEKVAAPG
jgi:hypothetical protein